MRNEWLLFICGCLRNRQTLHFTLRTLHSKLSALHSPLHMLHSTLNTLTPTLPTPHSKVYHGVGTEERAQYCWNMLQLVVFQGCDVHLGSRVRSSFSVIS